MKTKRTTISVEIVLFLIGLLLACYFKLESETSLYSDLFCNLSVGMSTGGMVAFLVEIPQIINLKKHNILILYSCSINIYMFLSQWENKVQEKKDNLDDKYDYKFDGKFDGKFDDKFNKYYIETILPIVFEFMNLDDNIYLCKMKNKEIRRLKQAFRIFKLNPGSITEQLILKIIQILDCALKSNDNLFEVTNGMLEAELTELQGKISVYIKTLDDVIEIISNKKQLKDWKHETNIIQNGIDKFKIENYTTVIKR